MSSIDIQPKALPDSAELAENMLAWLKAGGEVTDESVPAAARSLFTYLVVADGNYPKQFADPMRRVDYWLDFGVWLSGPDDPWIQVAKPKINAKARLKGWHLAVNDALGVVLDEAGYSGEPLTAFDEAEIEHRLETAYGIAAEIYRRVEPRAAVSENPFHDQELFHWLLELQQGQRARTAMPDSTVNTRDC